MGYSGNSTMGSWSRYGALLLGDDDGDDGDDGESDARVKRSRRPAVPRNWANPGSPRGPSAGGETGNRAATAGEIAGGKIRR